MRAATSEGRSMPSARFTRSGKHTQGRPKCRSADGHKTTAPRFSLRYVWLVTKMCSCWQMLHVNPGAKPAEFSLSPRAHVCAPAGNKILIFAGTGFRFSDLRRHKFTASWPRSPPLLLIDSAAHHSATRFAEFSINQNSWYLCPPDLRSSLRLLRRRCRI